MKNPIFKSIVILGTALALSSCSDDATEAINQAQEAINNSASSATDGTGTADATVAATDAAWLLTADQPYLIYPTGIVTDASGNVVGNFVAVEGTTVGSVVSIDGADVYFENIDVATLPVTTRNDLNATATVTSSDAATVTSSDAATVAPTSSETVQPTSSAENTAVSSSSEEVASSSSTPVQTNGTVTVTGSLTQTVAQGSKTSVITFSGVSSSEKAVRKSWNAYFLNTEFNDGVFTIKATTVPDYFQTGSTTETFEVEGVSYDFKLNVTAGSGESNEEESSSSVKSSSSSAKSSSSSAQSSSSSAKSSSSVATVTTGCPNIVKKSGSSGSGFASRYWDGCKPSCSWTNNAGSGNEARQCTANGKTELSDYNAQSVCNGGSAATCTSQIPFTISGCDNIGFAFAAVPAANGGQCGKCFQLTFTGTGKYETKANHKALVGKSLIVMVTNIGSDVNQGQFDVMIPGGGVGIYNGTAGYGWGSQGAQYGGLLSECESEVGYAGNLLTKRKECLVSKCNSTFSSDSQAKEGCLFLANFMEAAGNPNHTYTEVECPDVLKSRY